MKTNKNGGIDYQDDASVSRAKKADLLTLPKKVEGTNCGNCKFVKILDADKGSGFCTHKEVLLPVTKSMCCALWDHDQSLRSWKDKGNEKK
jgi:hypothetical protein